MFEQLANFFQGKGWVSNAQRDEDEKKRRQPQAVSSAPAPILTVNYRPNTTPSVDKDKTVQMGQLPPLPNIVLQKPKPQTPVNGLQTPQAAPTLQPFDTRESKQRETGANVDIVGNYFVKGLGDLFSGVARIPQFVSGIDNAIRKPFRSEAENQLADATHNTLGGASDWMDQVLEKNYGQNIDKATEQVYKEQRARGDEVGLSMPTKLAATGANVLGQVADLFVPGVGATKFPKAVRDIPEAFKGLFDSEVNTARQSLLRDADELERTVQQAPVSELGKIDDGISSPVVAEAKRTTAQDTANQLRQQADQIPDEPPVQTAPPQPAPQITNPDITNPPLPLTLQRATPEELKARIDAGDPQAVDEVNRRFDEVQQVIDAETVAPTPEAPVPDTAPIDSPLPVNTLDSPITAESRAIADATPPVSPEAIAPPVSDTTARLNANADAQLQGTPQVGKNDLSDLERMMAVEDFAAVRSVLPMFKDGDEFSRIYEIASRGGRQATSQLSGRDSKLANAILDAQAEGIDFSKLGKEVGRDYPNPYGKEFFDEWKSESSIVPNTTTVERVTSPQADPRISQLYQQASEQLSRADEILAREGKDVGQLGEKLYVADVNGTTAQLTPAEREAFDYLSANITDAERVLTSQGIIDRDLGIRRNYLPTGDEAGIERVFTPEDINASTFNYAKGRSGGFIKADGTVSGKLPKGIRAAYTDYYVRGQGSRYLSDAQVDEIKSTRISQTDMNDMMFGASKEPLTGIDGKPVKISSDQINKNADELVKLQREYSAAVKSGDESNIRQVQKAVNQKTIDNSVAKLSQMKREIDGLIKQTRDSNLPREQKVSRIVELENRLNYAEQQARYQQSYVKTNMLFQVPGRIADQVGKLSQAVGDALISPIANLPTRAFRPTTQSGRQAARTVAADPALNRRKNNYLLNTALSDANSTNILQRASGRYTATGTRVTELGSRQSAPTKDTARYFAAQAEAQGIEDITGYIRNAIGTQEWDRVFNQFSTNRNRFSGVGDITGSIVRGGPGMTKGAVNTWFDGVKSGLNRAIDNAFATSLPRSVRRNMADAISIPLIGFPRVVWNVGSKGMDYATFGMSNLYKASRVNVVDDATALQKALNLRDAIDGAAGGTGLVGFGVLLGQSDMITGSEPEKQANGEWVPPYSLKLGNDYVELGRFIGPYAVPIMLAAAISRGDNAANIASIPALVTSQVLANYGADSIGDTMSQIGDALNGDTSGLASRLPNMLAAFAPFSGEINSIANATDPYQRNTKDDDAFVQFMKQLTSKVPGLRMGLDAKLDQFGNEIPSSPLKAVIPLNTIGSGWAETELGKESNRLDLEPSGSSNTQENAEDWGNEIIATDWYRGLDDTAKKEALQSILYSGKLKDISNDLADEKRIALGVGTLMSPDVRDKWLEDKTNAVNYHVGRYENAIANDTLTAKDDNLENSSSLHYKAIAAQVNSTLPYWTSELEEQYKSISKKELSDMSPDSPVRQALLALDQARAGAGVSLKSGDHSDLKYGLGSGGSGSGRSGNKAISFASGSTVTAQESGFKQPTIKSDWDTPLVKPLGVGEASERVKRKISVKRGVSL